MFSADEEARRKTKPDELVASFMREFSIEAIPREVESRSDMAELEFGTKVYLTRLPKAPFANTLRAAKRVRELGMQPVPHLTARTLHDEAELREQVDALAGEAGVDEILLVAGSQAEPAGDFHGTMQVLQTGVFERAGIKRIGLAGHPEGHADVAEVRLQAALDQKNEFARTSSLELYLITQFFFDAAPVIAWERRIRDHGNRLPVHVGFYGLTGTTALLKHALACGIGASIKVLAHHTNMLQLAVVRSPDRLIAEIAQVAGADKCSLFARAHFFPLGGFARTARWAEAIAAGRFSREADGSLRVTD